jgi:hypothetical protein
MSVLRHAIAAMFSAGFLIAVAITVYVFGAAIGNDAGGSMVPFLIPLFAVIGGIATALLVYFPLSILFGWLSRKLRVSSWISPLAFLGLSFLFFTGWLVIVGGHFPSFSDFGHPTRFIEFRLRDVSRMTRPDKFLVPFAVDAPSFTRRSTSQVGVGSPAGR